MKNKPIVIFTGLAVAAVAAVGGLTRDRWMAPEVAKTGQTAETTAAGPSETKQPETQQATAEQPAATETQQAAVEQPAAEQPAVTETQQAAAEQPAAEQPAATETQQATAEQPAAEQPAAEPAQQATAEQPAAEQPAAEQPAAQKTQQATAEPPAAEQPAAPETQQATAEPPAAEQPAATETQQAATEQPAAEQPGAQETQQVTTEQPAAEQPAAPETQQAATEQPAAETPAQAGQPAAEPAPTFDTVRVEKTGEAVIAGQAQPGDQVAVKLDGKTIGMTEASPDGSFVVVPEQPLPEGSGALTIETKGDDGEVNESKQAVAVIIPEQSKGDALVAVVSPDEPTKVLQKPEAKAAEPAASEAAPEAEVATAEPEAQPEEPAAAKPKQVSLDAVDYDAAGNIVFSGQGQPGAMARIYVDNAVVGDAPIGPGGRWTFAGTTQVAPGVHTLRIDAVDGAGKVLSRIEAPFFREETSKVASAPEAQPEEAAPKGDNEAAASGEAEPGNETVVEVQPPAAKPPEGPKEGRLVIQPGNNLWRISTVIYGDGLKYALLYEANKDQIRNPDLIYPGQVFRTPDVEPPEEIDPAARAPLAETSTQ